MPISVIRENTSGSHNCERCRKRNRYFCLGCHRYFCQTNGSVAIAGIPETYSTSIDTFTLTLVGKRSKRNLLMKERNLEIQEECKWRKTSQWNSYPHVMFDCAFQDNLESDVRRKNLLPHTITRKNMMTPLHYISSNIDIQEITNTCFLMFKLWETYM